MEETQTPQTEQPNNVTAPPTFWHGLDDYNNDPAFRKMAEGEFQSSPLKEEDGKDGVARREFLKLMGASLALASASCVRRPVQTIIPYAQAPKEIIPGEPTWYTSTYFDGHQGYGMLVKTLEGRPIKVEGNPLHPMNLGALTVPAHGEILGLYDPDRLQAPKRNLLNKERTNRETINTSFEAADGKLTAAFAKGPVAILTSSMPSPSVRAMITDFHRVYPGMHVEMDSLPVADVLEAQRRSYGKEAVPRYRFDKAQMVVSIGADFLGTYLSPAEFMRQWAKTRTPGKDMSRLVVFEPILTVTGMNADDRIRVRPSQQLDVALALLSEIGKRAGRSFAFSSQYADVGARLGIDAKLFSRTVEELWANRGKGLVIAGGLMTQTAQALDLQIAVNMLNSLLGNDGVTVDHANSFEGHRGTAASLTGLIADMNAGKVGTLIIHGVNPLYVLPEDAGFAEAMKKVETVIYTGNYNDETGLHAQYVLPAGLSFESWGDFELQAGVYSVQQPTLRPLHATRSLQESLFTWAKASANAPARVKASETWYNYLQAVWREEVYPKATGAVRGANFDEFWVNVLQNGVVDTAGSRRDSSGGGRSAGGEFNPRPAAASNNLELVLYPKVAIMDGKFANVPWLQELPDPVTKIVWDNYLCVSPGLAEAQGLKEGHVVLLKVGEKSVKVPVHIQPGLHDSALGLAVGYGRHAMAGKVSKGIGVNAYKLASMVDGRPVFSGLTASIEKTGERYELACVQGHHQLEGRPIVGYTTNAKFQQNPDSGINKPHVFSIWPDHKYNKHKWGMAIDMNVCTGCSACVIACQSENNVPTVGKKYILQGREMHWIRIDRYYVGTPQNPDTVFQPMLCQHCETAPCETVCPVLATVHNEEGLNDMIYNRCVGTRYCSNNCPYKVRRFNWFNYQKQWAKPQHMALNPDVTVRSRGVMEKCTFCVQRIRRGTNVARDEKRTVKDGEIRTACEETCPTNAIVFGDLNDPESRVAKMFTKNERMYGVLEELATKPRVRYMSRIRNADREIKEFPSLPEHGPGHFTEQKHAAAGTGHGNPPVGGGVGHTKPADAVIPSSTVTPAGGGH